MQLLLADVEADKMFYNTFIRLQFSRPDIMKYEF